MASLLSPEDRAWAERALGGHVVSARRLKGGISAQTLLVTAERDGSTQRAVLRRLSDDWIAAEPGIVSREAALLDELEARGTVTPSDGLAAMLRPLVEQLDDADGRRYLRLLNQAINHPAYGPEVNLGFASSATRAAVHVAPAIEHLSPARRAARIQNALGAALYALAEQARQIDAEVAARPLLDGIQFEDELVTTLLGALRAEPEP